jgi:hypothetical protein
MGSALDVAEGLPDQGLKPYPAVEHRFSFLEFLDSGVPFVCERIVSAVGNAIAVQVNSYASTIRAAITVKFRGRRQTQL